MKVLCIPILVLACALISVSVDAAPQPVLAAAGDRWNLDILIGLNGHISSFFSEDLDSCWLWADSGAGPPVLPLAMPPPQHAPGLEILFRALTSELRW